MATTEQTGQLLLKQIRRLSMVDTVQAEDAESILHLAQAYSLLVSAEAASQSLVEGGTTS